MEHLNAVETGLVEIVNMIRKFHLDDIHRIPLLSKEIYLELSFFPCPRLAQAENSLAADIIKR